MRAMSKPHQMLTAFLLVAAVLFSSVTGLDAVEAAPKKKNEDAEAAQEAAAKLEEELKEELEPLSELINELTVKLQSRLLFSPSDAGQLAEMRFKLLDVISHYSDQPLIAKPVYQAGLLFSEREDFNDAYELFSFLSESFPRTSYGMKARGQIRQLERKLGENYFPNELRQTLLVPKDDEAEAEEVEKDDKKANEKK